MIDERICACDGKCWTRANKCGDRGGGWASGENCCEGFSRWVRSGVGGRDCMDALVVGGAEMGVGDGVMEKLMWVVEELTKEIAVGF